MRARAVFVLKPSGEREGPGLVRSRLPRLARWRPWVPLLLLVAASLATPSAGWAGVAARQATEEPTEAELAHRIEDLIGRAEADKAFWGIEVFSPTRGRVIYSRNAQRYFIPASITKLFTTAAALSLLGPDYQFITMVGARARIDREGRLLGHLYLVGGGDPDLGGCALPYRPENEKRECDPTTVLDKLAAQVAEKGVHTVAGDLVIDQRFFAPEPYPPGWAVGDLVWSYGAPVRALSLADNVLTLRVEPGDRVGDLARVDWNPFTHFYQIQNRVWTAPPGKETLLWVRRDPGSRELEISGAIALDHKGRTVRVAIEQPSQFIAELFREALARHGVRVLGETQVLYALASPFAREPTPALPVRLAEHVSLPLAADVALINKNSQNLHAEMLLRLLGRREPPKAPVREAPRGPFEPPPRRADGSAEAGLEVLRAWLATAGVNPNDVEFADGSGLSRHNLVTPHAVVQLLKHIETQPWAPLFRDSLPVAGVDGTLTERMWDPAVRGRVRAKTGSLNHTNALAGYLETHAGETLLFAVFLNHHTLEQKRALELIDELCALLVELPAADKEGKAKISE